ncbi:MAG: AMP-binding protein, partial [Deltaproteobacteria bacterium]|nr:AMP-binding protein [Deltaproteobacteria bacterium]
MNLVEMVEKNSRLYPRKAAFVEIKTLSKEREEIHWEAFHDRTNRLANALLDRGVTKGDKVFILGKNSINWIEAYFAVLKAGGWVVPLNFRFTNDDIAFCAGVAEPKAFILAEEYGDRAQEMRSQLGTVKEYVIIGKKPVEGMDLLDDVIQGGATGLPDVSLDYGDDCGLYFTSGTTGKPKPVLLTHLNLLSTAIAELTTHDLKEPDRTPQFLLQAMSEEQISVVFLLVPWALDLLEALDKDVLKKEDYDLSHWQLTHMGAQSIPPSIVQRLKEHFPDM